VHYLIPYSSVAAALGDDGTSQRHEVTLSYDVLMDIVRHLCAAIPVDQTWYCETYRGGGLAMGGGVFSSALFHYAAVGYSEDRQPFGTGAMPPRLKILMGMADVVPARGELLVRSTTRNLRTIVKLVLSAVPVDASWYLQQYPDVRANIARGAFLDSAEHFLHVGYFENRWPYEIRVDETWYLTKYPDVKAALDGKQIQSAAEHFRHSGYRESRLPYADIPMM
jgi:hypothetical protein